MPEPTKLVLLHIGKTGGTSLRSIVDSQYNHLFKNNQYELIIGRHEARIRNVPNTRYVFFVRCPVRRFISGFFSRLTRFLTNHPDLTKEEREIFETFKTPEQLASSLSSDEKELAQKAMQTITHLRQDISFYLEGIDHLKENIEKIEFVGTLENINRDFNQLLNRTGMPQVNVPHAHPMPDAYKGHDSLSEKSIHNIKEHYQRDYQILYYLMEQQLLSKDYLDQIL